MKLKTIPANFRKFSENPEWSQKISKFEKTTRYVLKNFKAPKKPETFSKKYRNSSKTKEEKYAKSWKVPKNTEAFRNATKYSTNFEKFPKSKEISGNVPEKFEIPENFEMSRELPG